MAEAHRQRALIFRMTGAESAGNAAALARTLVEAGFDPVTVPFWSDAEHAAEDPQAPVLIDRGFDWAPRLSAFAFRSRFGFSPDLIELEAHNLLIADARIDNLMTESVWSQQLRGAAARADEVLADIAPQVVFVPHGAEVLSRLIAAVVAQRGRPYLYWESAFFPGYHYVDPFAPHFFRGASRIDRMWHGAEAVDAGSCAQGACFMARAHEERLTKYRQSTDPEHLAELKAWLAQGAGPVLFVPGQIAFDATIMVSLRDYADLGSLYQAALGSLPPGWRAIFKPHPRGPDVAGAQALPEHVRTVRDISIHDLFPLCDAVALHSSNVGLEALMAGRPVFAWGDPYYGRKGLTVDLADGADLGASLTPEHLAPPDPARVAALVGHILTQGLVREGDGATLRARIAEASAAAPPPRLPWYGAPVQRLAAAGTRLDAELKRNRGMAAALQALPAEDRALLEGRFGARALRRHCRRTGRLGASGLLGRLLVAHRFSSRLGERVRFDGMDLEEMYDPEAAVAALVERVRQGARLLLLRGRPLSRTVIQSFTAAEAAALLARLAPDLVVDVFGWSGRGVTDLAPVTGAAVLLLRPAGASPLSAAQRAAVADPAT